MPLDLYFCVAHPLQERVAAYEQAAVSRDLDNFPYEEFAADAQILPVLLQGRAAQEDDPRAGFALEQFRHIETTLLKNAGFDPAPNGAAEERTLEQIESAVNVLLEGGRENLQPLNEIIGPLSRAVERDDAQQQQAVIA